MAASSFYAPAAVDSTKLLGVSRKLGEEMESLVAQIKSTVEANIESQIADVRYDNIVLIVRTFIYLAGFFTGVRKEGRKSCRLDTLFGNLTIIVNTDRLRLSSDGRR